MDAAAREHKRGLDGRLLEGHEVAEIEGRWRALRDRMPDKQPRHEPSWLRIQASTGGGTGDPRIAKHGSKALVAAAFDGNDLVGVAPFLVHRYPWRVRLGYTTVAQFPVKRAILAGDLPLVLRPEAETTLLDVLVESAPDLDVLSFESVPIASSWFAELRAHRGVLERYWVDATPPTMHRLVRFPEIGSFERYAEKWTGKTRRTLAYKVRKLEKDLPSVAIDRITERDQVDAFLAEADRVMQKSWQGTRLGQVIATDVQRPRLVAYADLGWLRCYVLRSASDPVAFVLGTQIDGVYSYEVACYDPRFAILHPGTVLLYRMIEDLCAEQPATLLDFGYGDNEYKRVFSNESFEESNVRLVRKGIYNAIALGTSRACQSASSAARTTLDRWGLRERVRHLLRGRTSRPHLPNARPGDAAR